MQDEVGKEKAKITEENLNKLKEKIKDKFTLFLINKLIKDIESDKKNDFYERLDFERIKNLIKKEQKRNKIEKNKKISRGNNLYVFEIKLRNRKPKRIKIKGNRLLSDLSDDIQRLFNHEPMHLHEFRLKGYKFGPECDEWQEIFDYLDNIRIDSALNSVGFKIRDIGGFIYDFGDNIKHTIKLIEIKQAKKIKNGK